MTEHQGWADRGESKGQARRLGQSGKEGLRLPSVHQEADRLSATARGTTREGHRDYTYGR